MKPRHVPAFPGTPGYSGYAGSRMPGLTYSNETNTSYYNRVIRSLAYRHRNRNDFRCARTPVNGVFIRNPGAKWESKMF
ncbi:hypothetical protein GOBAR_AA08846 [Gossypium barbadense]|uniref:Uncharacterized protein n=1 Tax=Gossypium barbadense TaxID=3634 RepID=A0A2P5Y870_GOSBA|nr:hypothetical protein GOBAR_AA08846 [Gossypium barbadense]